MLFLKLRKGLRKYYSCYKSFIVTFRRLKHNDGVLVGGRGEQPSVAVRRQNFRPSQPKLCKSGRLRHHGSSRDFRRLLLRVSNDLPLHDPPLLHDPLGGRHTNAGSHVGSQVNFSPFKSHFKSPVQTL